MFYTLTYMTMNYECTLPLSTQHSRDPSWLCTI